MLVRLMEWVAQLPLEPPSNVAVIYVVVAVVVVLGGGFVSLLILFSRARGWVKEMIDEAQGPMLAELRELKLEFHNLNQSLRDLAKEIQQILLDKVRSDGRIEQLQEDMASTRMSLQKLGDRVVEIERGS